MRFITALLAIAITITTGGVTEEWVLDDDPALTWVRTIATEAPVTTTAPVVHVDHTAERACLIVPIHTDDEGFLFLGPESEYTHTGGLEAGDIRVGLIGRFLNIAFGYTNLVASWDMVLSSIDVTGLTEVTICE